MANQSPIIIIGMHRSGTSLVCRMLEIMGVFVGKKKEVNNEAIFFQKLNKWIFWQSGGSWDYPQPVKQLLKNVEICALVKDYLEIMLKSPRVVSYLGWRKYIHYGTVFRLDIPWGWKDPRNTFALPIWLKIFPDAKVIHVYRHGVDVANSLLVRQRKTFQLWQKRHDKLRKLPFIYWLHPKQDGFVESVRTGEIEQGFSLWEEYMEEATAYGNELRDKMIEVKFEDLLENPYPILDLLESFCNLKVSKESLIGAAKLVNPDRACAYRKDKTLQIFAHKVAARLAKYGYCP